jgi:hypothetical protein
MRRCIACGTSLEGRDTRTRTCSARCRREAARFRAVLSGGGDGPYSTLVELTQRRSRARANGRNRRPDGALPLDLGTNRARSTEDGRDPFKEELHHGATLA